MRENNKVWFVKENWKLNRSNQLLSVALGFVLHVQRQTTPWERDWYRLARYASIHHFANDQNGGWIQSFQFVGSTTILRRNLIL